MIWECEAAALRSGLRVLKAEPNFCWSECEDVALSSDLECGTGTKFMLVWVRECSTQFWCRVRTMEPNFEIWVRVRNPTLRSDCKNAALSSDLAAPEVPNYKPRDPAVVDDNCGQRSAFRRWRQHSNPRPIDSHVPALRIQKESNVGTRLLRMRETNKGKSSRNSTLEGASVWEWWNKNI